MSRAATATSGSESLCDTNYNGENCGGGGGDTSTTSAGGGGNTSTTSAGGDIVNGVTNL